MTYVQVCGAKGGYWRLCMCMCVSMCVNSISVFTMGNENCFGNRRWWQGLCNPLHIFISRPQNENNFYISKFIMMNAGESQQKPTYVLSVHVKCTSSHSLSNVTNKSIKLKVHTRTCGHIHPSGWKGRKEAHPKLHEQFIDLSVQSAVRTQDLDTVFLKSLPTFIQTSSSPHHTQYGLYSFHV